MDCSCIKKKFKELGLVIKKMLQVDKYLQDNKGIQSILKYHFNDPGSPAKTGLFQNNFSAEILHFDLMQSDQSLSDEIRKLAKDASEIVKQLQDMKDLDDEAAGLNQINL